VTETLFKPMFVPGWFSGLQDGDHRALNKLKMKSTTTLKNGPGSAQAFFAEAIPTCLPTARKAKRVGKNKTKKNEESNYHCGLISIRNNRLLPTGREWYYLH
jgi:hypothetical protein